LVSSVTEPPRPQLTREGALEIEGGQLSCDLLYSEKSHFAAAEEQQKIHLSLGCAAAVVSAGAAATVFADRPVVTGGLALIGAIGTTLLTFLKPDKRAEHHLAVGRQLGALRVELRHLMRLDLGHLPDQEVRNEIKEITDRKAEIDSTAPATVERHFQAAKKKIDRGDFDDGDLVV
jgi:hypothetical protein